MYEVIRQWCPKLGQGVRSYGSMSEVRVHYPILLFTCMMDSYCWCSTRFSSSHSFTVSSIYSVMQSDGNSFCGDVVLDSFNMMYRDEDNILYQIYRSKYFRIIIMMILILYNMKIHTKTTAIPRCCHGLYFF